MSLQYRWWFWLHVVPDSAMRHSALFGRDSEVLYNRRSYQALPPGLKAGCVSGNLTLEHHDTSVYSHALYLRYEGQDTILLCHTSQLVNVNVICSTGGGCFDETIHGRRVVPRQPLLGFRALCRGRQPSKNPRRQCCTKIWRYVQLSLGPLFHDTVGAFYSAHFSSSVHAVALEPQRSSVSSPDLPPADVMTRLNPTQRASFISARNRLDLHL